MGRKRKEYPLIEGLEITALAAEGKAIGHCDGIVVFVPFAVPGDVVDVQVRSRRKRYMEGYVVKYVRLSPMRVDPVCEHFGVCGGCKWQNIPYAEQLRFKRQQVADQLTRIGGLELPEIPDALPSRQTEFYRNKLEFTFSPKRWMTSEEIASGVKIEDPAALGFHIPGMFDKVLDIRKCWLQPDPSNAIRLEVKRYCGEQGLEFYDQRTHQGLMRNLMVRTSSTGEVMVVVIFADDDTQAIEGVMGNLAEKFPDITSLMYVVNRKLNDSFADQQMILWSGRDHIFEEMEGLHFKIGGKSFYQTNSAQAYNLYKVAREFAMLNEQDTVYDLYTGTGTIANFVARGCKKVVGVEYVPEAIEDAKVNSRMNGIGNTAFFAGDMKKVLTPEFVAGHGRPDVVLTDPPRAGMDEPVVRAILDAAPARIVYVSCNPASQARDLALMADAYRIGRVQPVDMFPHTHHIENVVGLTRR